ncbi:MAG TPA: J domain-containing protein [Polyangiaceae bacterium]|jgi:DnaJ-class molecular chaperone|nr:J domain-containing protein [Polyangiaceae bacterium]HYQ17622.1 J domain-containing protein [Polyangiaceae bacterium]
MLAEEADIERLYEWAAVLDAASYYELLGLLEIADDAAVKVAFHDFALAFHPDAHTDYDQATTEVCRQVFQRGAEAYRVLSNPALRARYDLALAKGQLRLGGSEVPRVANVGVGAKSLDELCRTASAKRYAGRADELISEGDLRAAKRELLLALREDGPNPELVERLDALDLALFAMGA